MPSTQEHRERVLAHLEGRAVPMKRWNRKGSSAAIIRMSELRARKLDHQKAELMYRWAAATGRKREQAGEWWTLAQTDGLRPGCPLQARIDWLKSAIAKAEAKT